MVNISLWLDKLQDNGTPKQKYPALFNKDVESKRNINDSETVIVTESLGELTPDENSKDSELWRTTKEGIILYSCAIIATQE